MGLIKNFTKPGAIAPCAGLAATFILTGTLAGRKKEKTAACPEGPATVLWI